MTLRLSRWGRGAATFATLLLLTASGGEFLSAPLPRAKVQPLPPELVAAWKKAGAQVGWMRSMGLWLLYLDVGEGKPGDVPAFLFRTWPGDGVLSRLPPPQRAFGL